MENLNTFRNKWHWHSTPQDIEFSLFNLAEIYSKRFHCDVYVSDIIPRNDQYQGHVHAANKVSPYHIFDNKSPVQRISHNNIEEKHLYDKIHMRINKSTGERMPWVELLMQNIYPALINKARVIQHALQKNHTRNICKGNLF